MCGLRSKGPEWTPNVTTGGNEDLMADTPRRSYPISEYEPDPTSKHVHHGQTPAAWAGSLIALVGFIVGAIGLVIGNSVVFWVAVGLLVASLIVTLILRKTGLGAK